MFPAEDDGSAGLPARCVRDESGLTSCSGVVCAYLRADEIEVPAALDLGGASRTVNPR
jgi:hypothetical protein